jgi:hypothetical protein
MSKHKYRFGKKALGYRTWDFKLEIHRWKWLIVTPIRGEYELWEKKLIRMAGVRLRKQRRRK